MVKLFLKFKGELENITDLHPLNTPESPYEYTFRIECTSCREKHEKPVTINTFEKHEMSGSRGEASFVFKCRNCKRESSASITSTQHNYEAEDVGKTKAFLEIDSRGIEFSEFIPDGKFEAASTESNTKFSEVDLSDGEWYDYDDNAGTEVSIQECTWSIDRS